MRQPISGQDIRCQLSIVNCQLLLDIIGPNPRNRQIRSTLISSPQVFDGYLTPVFQTLNQPPQGIGRYSTRGANTRFAPEIPHFLQNSRTKSARISAHPIFF